MVPRDACPANLELARLIDGELPEAEAAALTRHLDHCRPCRAVLDRLAGLGEHFPSLAGKLKGADQPGGPALRRALSELRELSLADTADQLPPDDAPLPLRIGPYEVRELVGQGGFGRVYKVFDPSLQRVVAVKVMTGEPATSGPARQRFMREARSAAAITHENVITIHAVEEADGVPYIVMQFVPGRSLQDRLDRHGPPGLKEILRIGMQTARGLAAAHQHGIIHRDVKPGNILLENGVERVKLTDFGLARVRDDASLTQSGAVPGTPLYMAPEQARGEAFDHRADLFSLGSVLYTLCTGRPPFRAGSAVAVLKRVCDDTPRPIREVNPDVPEWFCAIVEKLHAKDPQDRFQSAGEVADLLGRYLAHLYQPANVPAPPPVQPPSKLIPTAQPVEEPPVVAQPAEAPPPRPSRPAPPPPPAPRPQRPSLFPVFFLTVISILVLFVFLLGLGSSGEMRGPWMLFLLGAAVLLFGLIWLFSRLHYPRQARPLYDDGWHRRRTRGRAGLLLGLGGAGLLLLFMLARTEHRPHAPYQVGPSPPPMKGTMGQRTVDGFEPLFDGQSLTGWTYHPDQEGEGKWYAQDGALVSAGDTKSHLFSEREFGDFELEAQFTINSSGNSGVFVRSPFALPNKIGGDVYPDGYEVQINHNHLDKVKTGSIHGHFDVTDSPYQPGQWNLLKVIARGNRIRTWLNGHPVADFPDPKKTHSRGRIVLQHFGSRTTVKFSRIAIRELQGPPQPAEEPFVLLAQPGRPERSYESLADAAALSSDGDVIEVRHNEPPAVTSSVSLHRSVVVRPGRGFRPVLKLTSPASGGAGAIQTSGRVVLEGLTLLAEEGGPYRLTASGGELFLAGCHLSATGQTPALTLAGGNVVLRHCIVHAGGWALWLPKVGGDLTVEDSLLSAPLAVALRNHGAASPVSSKIALRRNTFTAPCVVWGLPGAPRSISSETNKPLQLTLEDNVCGPFNRAITVLRHEYQGPIQPAEAEQALRHLCSWKAARNVYRHDLPLMHHESASAMTVRAASIRDLKAWASFWGKPDVEVDPAQGDIQFEGVTKWKDLGELKRTDFRLKAGSAGHKAGKDDRDTGADVDLLGPEAYEAWKASPAYAEWQKTTGQR